MSQVPPNYNRQYNFTGFSVNNPNAQQPGNFIDLEFNTIQSSLNQVISRLSEVQQDDGSLKMNQAQAQDLADASEGVLSSSAQAAVQAAAGGSHNHSVSQVVGLQAALDAKASTSSLTSGLAGKANLAHTHPISDVTGLQAALDAKPSTGHVHQISDVTGLNAQLYGRLIGFYFLTNSSGVFTPPAGTKSMFVEVQAGGGGGAPVPAVANGNIACSSGGGGGGYCAKYYSTIGAGYLYSCGGASGPGLDGNQSTFDSIMCYGGKAGVAHSAFGSWIQAVGGNGGGALNGDVNISGQKASSMFMSTGFIGGMSDGGNSHTGLGGRGVINSLPSFQTGYGSGGGGLVSYGLGASQPARIGSIGGAGFVRIWVYG